MICLSKTEGTAGVGKSSGKSLTRLPNMHLYSGYYAVTEEKSYAWMNLDDTKTIKEDASSEIEVRKDGKKLEVNLSSGNPAVRGNGGRDWPEILKDLAKAEGEDPSGKTPDGKTATPQAIKEAQRRQDGEEMKQEQELDAARKQQSGQPHIVSQEKAFPKLAVPTQGWNPAIDGGSASSGGSSSSSSTKPRTMKLKDTEV